MLRATVSSQWMAGFRRLFVGRSEPIVTHPEPLYRESESSHRFPLLIFWDAVKGKGGVVRGRESEARWRSPWNHVGKTWIEQGSAYPEGRGP